ERSTVVSNGPNPLPIILNELGVQVSPRTESNGFRRRMMGREQQPTRRVENAPEFGKRRRPIEDVMQDQRADDPIEGAVRRERQRLFEIGDTKIDAINHFAHWA